MKKLLICFMLLGVVFSVITSTSVEAAQKVVAITKVGCSSNSNFQRLAANEFYAQLETVIQNSGIYTVVERNRLDAVVKELGLHRSGLISDETSVDIGKMTGADYTVIGNVVGANVAAQDNVLYKSIKAKTQLSYKIVDNATGIVKIAEMVTGSSSMPLSDGVRHSHDQLRMLLSRAVAEAAEKVADKFAEMNTLAGSVMEISDNKVYVNLGSEHGVRTGDFYRVFREGKMLRDPAGNILGVVEEDVALAKVIDVKPNYCVMQAKKIKGELSNRCKVRKISKKK